MAARALVAVYNGMLVMPIDWDAGTSTWSAGVALLSGIDYFSDVTISSDGLHALALGIGGGNAHPLEWSGSAWVPGAAIHVDSNPQCVAISQDGQHALIACPGTNQIVPLEWSSGVWVMGTPITLASARFVEIAPDSIHAIATSTAGANVDKAFPIDWNGSAWVLGSSITLGTTGESPNGIAFTPDSLHALIAYKNIPWVASLTWNGSAWVADPLISITDNDPQCIAVNSDGTEALIACWSGESIVALEWSGGAWTYVSSLYVMGYPAPFGVFIGPDDDHAVVSAGNADFVIPLSKVAGVWTQDPNVVVGENPYGMGAYFAPDVPETEDYPENPSYWNAHRTIIASRGDTIAIPQWVRRIVTISPATVALNNDVGATVTDQLSGEWLRPSRLTSCVVGAAGVVVLKY